MEENTKEQEILEEIKEIDGELKRNWIILKALKFLKNDHEVQIGKLREEARKNVPGKM